MRRAVLMLTVCLFVLHVAEAKKSRRARARRHGTAVRAVLSDCEATTCMHLPPDENMNCVNRCASQACFDTVYASEPLEDGEVDDERERTFRNCLREELRVKQQQEREKAAKAAREEMR